MAVSNQENFAELSRLVNTPEGREFIARHFFSEITFPNAWGDPFSLLVILNGVERRVANIEEMLKQLAVKQGVVIDYGAIADAVNDNAAERLSK